MKIYPLNKIESIIPVKGILAIFAIWGNSKFFTSPGSNNYTNVAGAVNLAWIFVCLLNLYMYIYIKNNKQTLTVIFQLLTQP